MAHYMCMFGEGGYLSKLYIIYLRLKLISKEL